MRNALTYHLAQGLFSYVPRTRFVELVLNGNYYGVCLLTERIRVGENRVDIPKLSSDYKTRDEITGGYILKFDKGERDESIYTTNYHPKAGKHQDRMILLHDPEIEDINQEQFDYMSSHISSFDKLMASPDFDDPQHGFRQLIDDESYMNFFLINELTKDVDAYRLSTYFYKERESDGGRLVAGPLWDYNLAFGNANYCGGADIEGWAWQFNQRCSDDRLQVHFWWSRFLQDSVFVEALKTKYKLLRNTTLSNMTVRQSIDSIYALLEDASERNFDRWDILGKYIWPNEFIGATYEEEIDYLTNWTMERLAWLDANIDRIADQASLGYNKVIEHKLYPNPAQGKVNLSIETEGLNEIEIRVFSMHGRLIRTIKSDGPKKTHLISWNTQGIPGICQLQILASKAIVLNTKLVILE
jgi:hypothetical protein